MKIWKSCSKVIQRTLWSGKNWLRCSSFSVISWVKWPNVRAWPNFRAPQDSPTHTGKTRKYVKQKQISKNHCRNGSQWIALDKVDSGCAILIWKSFFQNFCLLPQSRHTAKSPFSNMKIRWGFPFFGRPPSGARIPIKLWSVVNISKFWKHFKMWQGFCPFLFCSLNPHSSRAEYSRNNYRWRCSNAEALKRWEAPLLTSIP